MNSAGDDSNSGLRSAHEVTARRGLGGAIVLHAALVLSGAAGLGYQIVWTRQLSVGLGHEAPGMLAVVAAFFVGLGVGALVLDRVVSRSATPGRWYAGLEVLIGVWAAACALGLPFVNELAFALTGPEPTPVRHWLVAFGLPMVALLPATAAMGASLPAIDRLAARVRQRGLSVGGLYAANTVGAMAGTLAAAFVLMPALGLRGTGLLLAAMNLAAAAVVLLGPARGERDKPDVVAPLPGAPARWRLRVLLAGTGMLGIGYEILAVRVLAQTLENTVYSFSLGLAVYLGGTAIGATLYQVIAARKPREFGSAAALLFALVGLAAAGGVLTMRALPGIAAQTRAPLIDALGDAQAGSLLAEGVCAMLVLGPITVVMGALFSHLAQASRHAGGGVGEAMGVNTLFGALGPVVFGVVLLPLVGARGALIACVAGYAVLAVLVGRRGLPAAVIVAVAAAAATPGELRHVTLPPGGTLGAYHEGVLGAVSVVNEADGERVLKVNDKFAMGGTRTMFPERRQAHLPIMLRTGLVDEPLAARAAGEEDAGPRVLFLGVGTGATMAGAAAHEPDLAVGVELVPEIIGVLPRFAKVNAALGWGESPDVDGGKAARARDAMAATVKPFHLVAADARRYVRASDRLYDVIIADLFHPARDGAGALYTREHFAAIRDRLAPGGVFCQWLPLHQMDLETVRIVVRTYLEVYEEPVALLAHFNTNTPMLGLAARGDGEPLVFREGALRRAAPTLAKRLALRDVALSNDMTFAGTLVAGPRTLRALSQASAVNTDDKPIVVFRAPARAYDASIPHWRTLADLLEATSPRAGEVLPTDADPAFRERLNAYWSARERFLEGRILDASDRHPEALRAYLEAAGRSEDFRTAYEVVLLRARDLAATDRFTARGLLEELERRVPSRTGARQLRLELFGR